MSDYLLPLGGANEVGASAYFLSVDGINIILDCGARVKGDELFPDYSRLEREITDYDEIDLILISHGHYDHIGSFSKIAYSAVNADIICTQDTKKLIEIQLINMGRVSGRKESDHVREERFRQAQTLMTRVQIRPVMKFFERKGCRVMFMPAGHMAGAVMIYIETKNHKVLYSGDFGFRNMFGVNELKISDIIHPTILLLNATNAYKYSKEWNKEISSIEEDKDYRGYHNLLLKNINQAIEDGENIYFTSKSIPKHLDLFYFLEENFPNTPIYLEERSSQIADALSSMDYQIYRNNIFSSSPDHRIKHFVIGEREGGIQGYRNLNFDNYSLHATGLELLEFTKRIGAEETFLLHTYPNHLKKSIKDILIEQGYRKKIIQATNGQKYYLKKENKMKYLNILNETMEKEMEIALKEENKNKKKNRKMSEWAAVYGSLMYPDIHPKTAYLNLKELFWKEYNISYDEYMDALRSINLDNEEKRKYVISIVEKGVDYLKRALDGDKKAAEAYSDLCGRLQPRDKETRKLYFIGKYMTIFIILIDPDMKDNKYLPIVINYGAVYCDKLLRSIRDGIFKELHLSHKKKSARDVLKETKQTLNESAEASRYLQTEDELEKLRFENNNYKSSLELVQSMLDELKETIEESATDAKNNEVASFYTKMNSDEFGNLLDSMEFVNKRLVELRAERFRIPSQILPLTIVFKQMNRFIKESGITPIDRTGREFEAEVEALAEFTYIGEAYTFDGEKKRLRVERPGWKYKDTVISFPTVREVEE